MGERLRVFLTGASGRVGSVLVPEFAECYALTALYRQRRPDDPGAVFGDLGSPNVLRRAMEGVDVVVHLAAYAHEADFVDVILPNNVVGTYNVFRAAREAGVRRLVFASTCHVVQWRAAERTIRIADPLRPTGFYGVSKVFGEALGRHYHEQHGMEVVCIRIGWLLPYEEPGLKDDPHKRGIWLSPRDAVRLFRRAVEKPDVGYAVVFGTSLSAPRVVSLREARELLDYEPEDDVVELYGSRPEDDALRERED
ncbi:MAG: NAD(P)-dependent oxidoreductase [Candidatus Brocadiaceae bacterium]|jgi:nucleoside-diphosphate-sugar epimerase